MRQVIVAHVNDLKNGGMKSVKVGEKNLLLVRIDGEYFALGASCPHYGAPLETGLLSGERIVCPWHHACFHAKTGDLQEPPARDALAHYEVSIDGENVVVHVPDEIKATRKPKMSKSNPGKDDRSFVIIGAGAAGNAAAQTLREDGFEGQIFMITNENRLPYDRPNLSKEYLQGNIDPEWMPLQSKDFYQQYDIQVMLEKQVDSIDYVNKKIGFVSNDSMAYDKLLLASGGIPIQLDIPGSNLDNIYTLRSYDDADRIIEAAKNASRAIIIGASFIGMETAFGLRERNLDVTVVAPSSVPFEHNLGKEVGKLFQILHEEKGVQFKLKNRVIKFTGNGSVQSVELENGESLETDLVIVGIGVKPATAFLKNFNLLADGSLKVNPFMQVREDIFAAGDIATFTDWRTDENTRIEHWRTAEQQGRMAAHNMVGKKIEYRSVPFFWTTQVGLHFRYVGHAKEWDETIVHGDISAKDFLVFYVKKNQVLACSGNGRNKEMDIVEELMRLNKMPKPDELRNESVSLIEYLNR